MKRNWTILAILALLIVPALACQTVMGAVQPTPTVIEEIFPIPTIEVPDIQVTVPDIDVTIPAIPTVDFNSDAPEDIPILEPNENLIANAQAINYTTTEPVDDVLSFYQTEMVAQGWVEAEDGGGFATMTIMNYTKDNRAATVTITDASGSVVVAILITEN